MKKPIIDLVMDDTIHGYTLARTWQENSRDYVIVLPLAAGYGAWITKTKDPSWQNLVNTLSKDTELRHISAAEFKQVERDYPIKVTTANMQVKQYADLSGLYQ